MIVSINKIIEKVKILTERARFESKAKKSAIIQWEKEAFYSVLLALTALLSFGLGRLTKIEEMREPLRIENLAAVMVAKDDSDKLAADASNKVSASDFAEYPVGSVIVSVKGKRYHFPWCSGAKTIKAENKLVLTEQEALAKGYTLAANCKSRR